MEAFFRPKKFLTMIDSGASHNYMIVNRAINLGLQISPSDTCFEAISSPTRKIDGDVRNVVMRVGSWQVC